MKRQYIRGRNRVLTPELRVKLCQLVRESSTLVEAAEAIGVSLRTVQRERKYDEDFDHELLLALSAPPDPLKLMQAAARTHWRAAAWLLERTRPEQYARRPTNMAHAGQVNHAVNAVMEAVLQLLPPAEQERLFPFIDAACQRALDCCFPNLGPWGHPRSPKLPQTPLGNHLRWKLLTQAPGVPAFLNDEDRKLAETFIKQDEADAERAEGFIQRAKEGVQRAEGFIPSVEDNPDDDATVIEDAPAAQAAAPRCMVPPAAPSDPSPSREDLYELALAEVDADFPPACGERTACAPGKEHCLEGKLASPCIEPRRAAPSTSPPQEPQPEDQEHFVAKNAFGDKMSTPKPHPPA
ncbi:hypothetical protein [Lacipirellula parvula]|uniref:Transposase IS30-like HTH domain-containing protein n=1 Tax=Lacipirellula parvula TaxID=2650471 RepID=A0A5K7XJG2_9BACT|nr:hypothetical protein [Lacipirellula parvula]BBO36247.1 hypothetical protein PLANPX_5859 [Lacipirellula parvula]